MTQKEALEILKQGHSAFITGAAGSGKTYLLNEFVRFLKNRGKKVGITASTGIAATHLGGLTIHSWAGIGIRREATDADIKLIASNSRVKKRLSRADVLVIDEISMLDAGRLDLVNLVAKTVRENEKPFGGMQVILCGDFFQLPPIAKEGEAPPQFAYLSSAWEELSPKICYLQEQFRQGDEHFLDILNAIRQASVSQETVAHLHDRRNADFSGADITRLYSHNINVDAENSRKLESLPGKEKTYQMETFGVPAILKFLKGSCLAPEVLSLKKDAAVMFVKNNFEEGYVNGTLGRVLGFDESDCPVIGLLDGRKISAVPEEWSIEENGKILARISQVPLRLAWAITIHKSQGMTLDAAEIDLRDAFEKGMGYVALSRVRTLSGMRLLGFNDMALKVNEEILKFDEELKKLSEEAAHELRNNSPVKSFQPEKVKPTPSFSIEELRKIYPTAYSKWTAEEEIILRDGFSAGLAKKEIADKLGRKPGAIHMRLIKLGLIIE